MTAMAHEPDLDSGLVPDLDEVLRQAWRSLELPEGYRAEIVEGFIEVSPTGRRGHARIASRAGAEAREREVVRSAGPTPEPVSRSTSWWTTMTAPGM